jgi:hypothetical protein
MPMQGILVGIDLASIKHVNIKNKKKDKRSNKHCWRYNNNKILETVKNRIKRTKS